MTLEANDHDGGTELDNNTAGIRDYREVEYTKDEVRYYSADGTLYAYRDGDEHVVVSKGREPQAHWTSRVPAKRDNVNVGDHLWTIPDNWRHRLKINGAAEALYGIYHIPEAGADILVGVPRNVRLGDAWYNVEQVGELTMSYDDEIDWEGLEDCINTVQEVDEVSEEVVNALETLSRCRETFEQKFVDEVERYAEQALLESSSEPVSLQNWTTSPWREIFEIKSLVQDVLDVDAETLDGVLRELSVENIVPSRPAVQVHVVEQEGSPEEAGL